MYRREFVGALAALAVTTTLGGCSSAGGRAPADRAAPRAAEVRADLPRDPVGVVGSGPAGLANFGARMLAAVGSKPGNVMVSPLSIAVALAMTRNGAQGQSASQLDEVLGTTSLAALNTSYNAIIQTMTGRSFAEQVDKVTKQVTVEIANTLWGQRDLTFEQPFLERLARSYGAGMNLVDYRDDAAGAIKDINSWCTKATHDRIKAIVDDNTVTMDTRLVLANALYFKAPWLAEFVKLPDRRPFGAPGRAKQVPTMQGVGQGWAEGDGWQAARIDYWGGKLAMTVVLPSDDTESVLDGWTRGGLSSLLGSLRAAQVEVTMPLWTAEWGDDLTKPLKAMGLTAPFEPGPSDFDPMTTQADLFVSAVVHKTWIGVDEHGTEAAAVTAVVMDKSSAVEPVERHTLVLDRPFLYVIHDIDTLVPLFVGRLETVG